MDIPEPQILKSSKPQFSLDLFYTPQWDPSSITIEEYNQNYRLGKEFEQCNANFQEFIKELHVKYEHTAREVVYQILNSEIRTRAKKCNLMYDLERYLDELSKEITSIYIKSDDEYITRERHVNACRNSVKFSRAVDKIIHKLSERGYYHIIVNDDSRQEIYASKYNKECIHDHIAKVEAIEFLHKRGYKLRREIFSGGFYGVELKLYLDV